MPEFDVTTPSIARVYDYLLGGKDNFAVDRELGDKLRQTYPPVVQTVHDNKKFLTRAVSWVASQGIGQFIDLGAGLPTAPSTQETAVEIAASPTRCSSRTLLHSRSCSLCSRPAAR